MRKRSKFKHYKTDEFMLKFLNPNSEGVRVVVYMRRKERRPNTLSLHEEPVFECKASDLMGDEKESVFGRLMEALLGNSSNVRELLLSGKVKNEKEKVPDS